MIQLVQVVFEGADGPAYTYGWEFDMAEGGVEPLKVGDRVVTPPNWRRNEEGRARVVALGSDWPGPVHNLLRRVEHDDRSNQ